jgi:hypothetical protein
MVAELKGRMSLNGQPFIDTLKNVSGEIEGNFQKSLNKIGGQIAQAFTLTAVVNFANKIISTADEVLNLSNRLGVSAETVQSLQIVAKEAGIDFGTFENAISKATKSANDALTGNENLTKTFELLGLSLADIRNLNPEQLFESIAAAMANGEVDAKVLNAAFDILGGETGPKLKELLVSLGKDGFDQLNQQMKDSNQILSDQALKNWDDLGDKIAEVGRSVQSFVGEYGSSLIQFIQDTAGAWGQWSAGGTLSIDDYRAAQKEVDESNRKNKEQKELALKAQRDAIAAAEDEAQATKEIDDLSQKLADKQRDRLPPAQKLAELKKDERDLVKEIKDLEDDITNEGIKARMEKQLALLGIQDQIVRAEKDLENETKNTNREKEKSRDLAKDQLDNFNTLKNTIRGMTDKELSDFLTKMQSIAYAIAGLSDIPKDKLAWVSDLAQLEFKGLTTSQADQMVRALTSLVNGIASLSGKIPSDMLDFLEDLNNLKFSGLTSGQASQMVRAIETLVNGLKALSGTDLSFITDLMNSLQGATPGKYEIAISLPDEFKDGFPLVLPDGMEGNLNTIAKNLETLAGLKGVVWA